MAAPLVVAAGRVQSWRRKTIKQHILSSIWDQLSNRTTYNQTVPHSRERKVSDTVVCKVRDEFNEGSYQTTLLWVGRPQFKPIAGPNKAEGKERKVSTKIKTVHYNVQRFPIAMNDRTVEGDITKFYRLAEQTSDVIKDLFVESTDYDHERALCEGSDEWLTESTYWQDSEYGSNINAPNSKVLHPNIFVDSASGGWAKNSWSETFATAIGALSTACDDLAATDVFDLATLDRIHLQATRDICKLGGYSGNSEVKWVLKLSDAQWYQCTTDQTANAGWRQLLKYTEKGFDMMLHGHIGVYKNMLIVVSQRSPIFKCDASGGEEFQYVTSASDGRTRTQTTGAGTEDGTCEIAALLGRNAICLAEISEADYTRKGFDYDFSTGMCGTRCRGTERTDLDTTNAATSGRTNESSFLVMTASTTATA